MIDQLYGYDAAIEAVLMFIAMGVMFIGTTLLSLMFGAALKMFMWSIRLLMSAFNDPTESVFKA